MDGASEQAAGAGGTKPLHERYGFSSEDEMAKAFDALKADLRAAKTESRNAREAAEKLAAYEAAEAKRAEAEKTELQKMQDRMAALEGELRKRDTIIKAREREVLRERVLAERLGGKPAEEARVLRRLYDSALMGADYDAPEDLLDLLKPVEEEWANFIGKQGSGATGGRPPALGVQGGAARSSAPGHAGVAAAVREFMQQSATEQLRAAKRLPQQ